MRDDEDRIELRRPSATEAAVMALLPLAVVGLAAAACWLGRH